ncbi:MAG: lamin tail domain-containing protein, partial [Thermoplasmata archaeon]|nr:lamin tail domain-containing protein [Thermoplasmata archaeon]
MVERARIGIKVIDSLIEGGIPRKTSVAVQGPSGNEKYDLALSFLKEGIQKGEAVVVALSSVSPEEFKRGMLAIGIDAEDLLKKRLLRIIDWYSHKEKAIIDIEEDKGVLRCSVDLINVGIAFSRAIADLDESTEKRAVVEILSPALNEYDIQKVYGFAQSTKAKLEKIGFTSLFLVEKEMHDGVTLSTLLQPFDGVIDIERTREGDRIVRKVGVLSMKNTKVDSNYVPLAVSDSGIGNDVKEQKAKEAPEKTEDVPETESPQMWFDLGTRLLLQGEPERALKCFDKILSSDPSHVGAWASKANTLKELGRTDEATECYKQALVYSTKGAEKPKETAPPEPQEPGRECSYCSETIPNGTKFCDNCGMNESTADIGGMDINRIMRVCNVKLDRDPEDIDALFVKGATYEKIGNHERSLEALDRLTDLDPRYPGVWILKAKIHARLGDRESAIKCREMALSYDKEEVAREEVVREQPYECPMCGQSVSEDAVECENCGARFDTSLIGVPEPIVEPADIEVPKPAEADKREMLRREIAELKSRKPRIAPEAKETPREKEPAPSTARVGLTNGLARKSVGRGPGRTNGLTNGKGRGRTNGLTNGRGRTNGLTNGRGRTNGLTNGRGRTNGLVNGLRGRVNGLTNGLVNGVGRVNGLTNGLVNGLGRVNGLTKGVVNGLRSFRSGLTNGVTNGLGLTNGLGSGRFSSEAKFSRWKVLLIPLIAVALLMSSLFGPVGEEVATMGSIRIDGQFSDWTDASRTQSSGDFMINPNIDIIETAVENNVEYVSFYLRVSGSVLQGEPTTRRADTVHIFIDVDRSYGTGYQIRGIGADFIIEVYGTNGEVALSRLMRFDTNRGQEDWSSWLSEVNVHSEVSGQNLETQVYWPTIATEQTTIDVLFHAKSWNGHEDFADFISSNSEGILLVRQRSGIQNDILTGVNQVLLEVDLFAVDTDIEVLSIEVAITGTAEYSDVSAVELVDLGGTPVSQRIWMGPTVIFDAPITIQSQEMERYYVVADIASTSSGNTIGASIPHTGAVTLTSGVVTIERVAATLDVGYIEMIPSDIVIDGGFADWLGTSLDSNDEPETGLKQSIDIRSYDAANDNTSASFYLKVDGEVFGGTSVPYDTPTIPTGGGPVIIDSDRDSVPDNVDGPNGDGTRPFDFDNDGVPDVQTGYDYDGDGDTDYPFGLDEWLQTTIPENYPAAYANVTVSIFIGQRVDPVILGEDISLIFIDTNETSGTGYGIGPVFTEYMIQVRGKNGHIISSELFEHAGTSPGQWIWSSLGNAEAGTDYSQLEVHVLLTSIGLGPGDGFGAYFYTSAWSQAGEDYSDDALSNITTRSTPESRTRHFADGNGGYGLVAPDGGTIDITIDGEINETNENDWTSTAKTDTYGSYIKTYVVYNSTDLFVAVESLSQATGSGSPQDYAEITFDTNHDGGTAPQTDDYKFRVKNDVVNEKKDYAGTGSAWDEPWTPSSSWDAAVNDTDTYLTYEFRIPLEYAFNTSTPSDGHIGGFCVHVRNNTGSVYYYWPDATGSGETNSREDTPNDWGDLFYKRPRLVINEVSPNTTSEWVELYNDGDSIDINGIVLSDQDGFTWTRSSSLVVPNGVYLTLLAGSGTDDTDFSDGNGTLYIGTTEFNNTGDDVLLKFGGNDMGFDYMQYGSGSDIQSCPSDPASENSWTGTLTAPSGTDSAGRDKTSSDTNAASDWDNNGGPDVNQRTRGHVNYLASLTVTGEDQAPANVQQNQTLVVMLNLTLSANYGWIEVTEIDVNRTGTSSTEADISAATLWLDVDEDGEYDSGTDTFIKTGTYASGNYTFSSLSIHVHVNSPKYLLVIYNISSSATGGVTVGAQVDGESNVTVASPDTVAAFSEINSTNSTIQGNQLSVSGTDKAPATVSKGQTEVVMLSLNLSTTIGSVTLTQIEVNRTGTSTTEADISNATLWHDVDNNGAYDVGTDVCLAVGSYSGGFYTFSSLSFAVNPGTDEFLLVMYNVSATANGGVTVGARIDGADNVTVQSPDTVTSFSPIQSTNSLIQASTVTVVGTDKAPATVVRGQTAVVMLNLTLTADYGAPILTALDVNRTGTSTTEADISQATLWHDVNDDGDYDAGTDVCLGAGSYSNGNYTFSGLSFGITAGTPERLLAIYNVSSSANTGVTVGARIDGEENVTLSGSDSVVAFSPIQSTNSTINGNELDVYGGDIAIPVVFEGEDFAEMLNLTLSTDYGSVTVTQIEVTKTGTSSQSSDIDAAVLYEDVNGDGDYDSGTDTYIATGSFSSGVYTFSSLSISVSGGTDKDLLVMYNISASATLGVTVGAKINGASDITVQSPDSVASFSAISSTNAIIRDSDVFVLEVTGEVYESTDGGKSFSYQGDASADFVAICINRSNDDLYAFVKNGSVYRSTDKGQNWVWRGDAFTGAPAGIDMTIDSNDYIYLLQTDGDIYQSTDGGATFNTKGDVGASTVGIEANYSNDDLYVVVTGGDVAYSSDGGDTWTTRGDASPNNDVVDIAIDSNGYLYVLEGSGEVYRSTDYGDTFSQMGDIGTDTYSGICIDTRYDYIYVIEDTGQVYLSVDSGANWTLRSDIGSETDYEDITCYVIPEFSEIAAALIPILILVLVA